MQPIYRPAVLVFTRHAWLVYDLARCVKVAAEPTRARAITEARAQGYTPLRSN